MSKTFMCRPYVNMCDSWDTERTEEPKDPTVRIEPTVRWESCQDTLARKASPLENPDPGFVNIIMYVIRDVNLK